MKNIKIKSVLLAIVFLSVMSFVGTVYATGASVYVSPASLTKTAGDVFNVSVGFNASGNKVCAAEGTLNFTNLSCQSITVVSGVMAQATPTCSNPYFLIGIPNCTTTDKVLLTVSVKAGSAGVALISPTSVDVIGEGVSAGSGSIAGNYTINAIPVPKTTPTTPQPSNGFVGYVNGKIQTFATMELAQQAGATGIEPNYQRYPAETTPTPKTIQKVTEPTNQLVETPVQEETTENNLVASAGATSSATGSTILWVSLIVVVVLGTVYGIYYFIKKGKKGQI